MFGCFHHVCQALLQVCLNCIGHLAGMHMDEAVFNSTYNALLYNITNNNNTKLQSKLYSRQPMLSLHSHTSWRGILKQPTWFLLESSSSHRTTSWIYVTWCVVIYIINTRAAGSTYRGVVGTNVQCHGLRVLYSGFHGTGHSQLARIGLR